VFCGINGFDDAQIAGYPEVTGVLESLDPRQTIQLALRFHPYNRHVVAIFDSTESSDPTVEACREALGPYAGQVQARFLRDLTMDHLLNEVEQLPPDSIILLGNFNRDKSGNTFSHEETLALIRARTKAPIYGLWDFLMGQGIVGGSLLSGRLQGATAARMALLVLNGTPVEAIPIVRNSPTRLVFDYRELSRFGIPFETLPPGSTVINQPEDSIGRYKGHVGLAATASSFY
jgi:two-component system cell cycle sensor histidine kinase/response regulator CckA